MPPTEAHGAETELIFFLIGDKQTNKTAEQRARLSFLQQESSPVVPKRYNRSRRKILHFPAIKSDSAFQSAAWNWVGSKESFYLAAFFLQRTHHPPPSSHPGAAQPKALGEGLGEERKRRVGYLRLGCHLSLKVPSRCRRQKAWRRTRESTSTSRTRWCRTWVAPENRPRFRPCLGKKGSRGRLERGRAKPHALCRSLSATSTSHCVLLGWFMSPKVTCPALPPPSLRVSTQTSI